MNNENSKVLAIADKVGYWKCWSSNVRRAQQH